MNNKYINSFLTAKDAYIHCQPRAGYKFTLFSVLRHSFSAYPELLQYEQGLLACADDESAKSYIQIIFDKNAKGLHHHSFLSYWLDLLIANFPYEKWENFHPKIIAFYQGIVYRGTLQSPDEALKFGMQCEDSSSLEDYIHSISGRIGVSTSKDIHIANGYKDFVRHTKYGSQYVPGFLYKINYRGNGGVDICQTYKLRKSKPTAVEQSKEEVNVIGKILPDDIMGYWDAHNKYHEHKFYDPNRKSQAQLPAAQLLNIKPAGDNCVDHSGYHLGI